MGETTQDRVIIATFVILFKRVKNNYGAEDRTHLNEYRINMNERRKE